MKPRIPRTVRRGAAGISVAVLACAAVWYSGQPRGVDRALLDALESRDTAAADSALRHGANPNLAVAPCWPSHQVYDQIVASWYRIRKTHEYPEMPVLIAVTLRHDLGSVRMLLAHGANPDARLPDGATALSLARSSGSPQIVAALKNAGAR